MSDAQRPPLERGTALTQLWDAAEGLRLAQQDLARCAEGHALTVLGFVRQVADGVEPDPVELLRSHGMIEALTQQVQDRVNASQDALSELRFGLLDHPDADPGLEERAMVHLRARFMRRAVEPLPEDPRPVEGER